jgi:hypothetical protein
MKLRQLKKLILARHIIPLLCILFFSCYKGHGLSGPGNIPGIQGRITFIGEWPDSTNSVRIVVLKTYPKGITNLDSLTKFLSAAALNGELKWGDPPIPMHMNHYYYKMILDPGEYEFVLVAWFPDLPGTDWIYGVRELGAYYKIYDQEFPSSVTVYPGVMTDGIDIIADFANIENEMPFF